MIKHLSLAIGLVFTCISAGVSTEQAAPAAFQLTVDSIMRGPELVGNPPNNLRWSGDSKELYFERLHPERRRGRRRGWSAATAARRAG